ncbi:fumarylacetoacetate hydrolase domain-containing protein 2A isoform X2 [Cheilinus undulatus]|nr:fumarylacetoacetate hydrolase domain-containing protein 2A isoform X2 [Cheilinus undulatus]XP_041643318.1 fumarylacetoacetate hydrolase domain-containing protein 2A isoform X2 [Cheilinus undulatus]XP_041643319.1 fumarylacetoacetate hydrolase domain-containing protein 2A isoform X2 [Cheilinus undulatus]XP_041643320.1 fumarylacetoacetate hydrolase domain-containing protein 2A isoform X2 [Cheilinus undulatus]
MRLLFVRSSSTIKTLFSHRPEVNPQRWRGLSGAAMRLVQFHRRGDTRGIRVGVELGEGLNVVDLKAFDPSLPSTMRELLELGDEGLQRAQRALSSGQCVVERSDIQLLSPVLAPEKVVCVGMNYRDHCLEQNAPIPKEPIIFSKFPSAITGPFDNILLPSESQEVDWEVELAFVIGRRGKHIKEEDALSYVAGFTVANDVSARDWQMNRNGKQWLLGKTFDSFCPLGPALVTTDALKDPHNLAIRCLVNGDTVQSSNTDQMIFKTEALVAWVSKFVTLTPGDVVLTGTPPGVGVFRKPPVFLKRGDIVECQIDQIGSIINKVV